mmetsp:Transcript_120974/g.342269  ORF Transcript_120974/g.342269 Transcript_120974/m.342269 type:complete len:216 (+) Transcript_120974:1056-1703(+)
MPAAELRVDVQRLERQRIRVWSLGAVGIKCPMEVSSRDDRGDVRNAAPVGQQPALHLCGFDGSGLRQLWIDEAAVLQSVDVGANPESAQREVAGGPSVRRLRRLRPSAAKVVNGERAVLDRRSPIARRIRSVKVYERKRAPAPADCLVDMEGPQLEFAIVKWVSRCGNGRKVLVARVSWPSGRAESRPSPRIDLHVVCGHRRQAWPETVRRSHRN